MSKSLGQKIAIKFTEPLTITNKPIIQYETQDGTWTANGTYGGSADTARDADTGTYWQSRSTANYIQIIRPGTKIVGLKVYKGSSYRPSSYTLRTSDDGTTYTDVKTGGFAASTGWETAMFDAPIESDYLRINFGYSRRLYLYELVLIVEGYSNLQANDFLITGPEYKYINGELLNKRYEVETYGPHPTEPNAILLTFKTLSRFPTVEGDLTVEYDAANGLLAGHGGAVDSFIQTFAPEDLIPEPNPGIIETIIAAPGVTYSYQEVEYASVYETELDHIVGAPGEITLAYIHINDINP